MRYNEESIFSIFMQTRRLKLFFLCSLLFIGAFLRLYRLPHTMQFLGDQGRDALIARRILIDHHPALIGPVTSVGNMYLGPFYYYFMVFPLMLSYPSPVGPAYAVALIGVATIYLLYRVGKELVGETPALIATALYTFSPVVITNVRFSWNPNIVPFFSLLFLWFLHKTLKGNYRSWIWVGVVYAILMQLHYITLILAGFAGCVWIYELVVMFRKKKLQPSFFTSTIVAIAVFFISLIPLIVFDVRHGGTNSKAFEMFFQGSDSHFRLGNAISSVFFADVGMTLRTLFEAYTIIIHGTPAILFFFVLMGLFAWIFFKKKQLVGVRLILSVFVFSMLILSLYSASVFDHYLGFVFPIAALVVGILLAQIYKGAGKIVVIGVVGICIVLSLLAYPGKQNLGYNIFLFRKVAESVVEHTTEGEFYDILVYTDTNDAEGTNYRYFLTTMNRPPATPEQVHDFKTLLVIDEQGLDKPLDTPHYKLVHWPNRTVVETFTVPNGPVIYKLVR